MESARVHSGAGKPGYQGSTASRLAIAFPVAKAWINRLKPALNPGSIISRILFALVMASVGWALCGLHLLVFDKLFLRLGRVRR